ncbi:MAG: hypothetical protein ABSB25_03975 [Sedimentisphaerales bacterium]|jgi:uncharacterized membrane protein
MKTAMTIVLTLVLVAASGCQSSSPKGGSVLKGEGFKIAVPTLDTKLKQGETQSVTVSLERGDYFKQDVKLQIEASKGISVEPTSVVIKASDKPDVQLRIAAAQNAAFGEYSVSVKGIPKTGESTSTVFTVKVVSP